MRAVQLRIEDVAFGGKGVGRDQGKAVFVPFTIDGERVQARILRKKKQFAEAEVVDLIEASPHRVAPPCPYFGRCGGCVYQHIDYQHQLAIKERQVGDLLRRIGKIENVSLRPIVPSPLQYGYRNRITVHVDHDVVGFFRRDSHRLIDIECCPIAMPEVNDELQKLRTRHPHEGHFTLRPGGSASSRTMLKNAALPPLITSSSESSIHHFTQTNHAVANALRDLIVDLVPANQELLIDAFCGAGFFAKALLDKFERVIGIDWDKFAIAAAKKTATEKETYIAGDVDVELAKISRSGALQRAVSVNGGRGDRHSLTLIADPPASGLSASVRKAIVGLAPATLLYISCNPATLARDLKQLRENFTIESITPFDMFAQTAEIEVAVHLQHLDKKLTTA